MEKKKRAAACDDRALKVKTKRSPAQHSASAFQSQTSIAPLREMAATMAANSDDFAATIQNAAVVFRGTAEQVASRLRAKLHATSDEAGLELTDQRINDAVTAIVVAALDQAAVLFSTEAADARG